MNGDVAPPADERDTLDAWLAEWYPLAFRSARLILGSGSEAEDAVQDACLRLWRFRASIPDGEAARAWRYRVLVNACFSQARRDRRRTSSADGVLAELPDDGPGPEEAAQRRSADAAVRGAILALPEALRLPLVLRYYAGLSEREIATAIGRRAGTVKSRLHEARQRLGTDPELAWLATEDAR